MEKFNILVTSNENGEVLFEKNVNVILMAAADGSTAHELNLQECDTLELARAVFALKNIYDEELEEDPIISVLTKCMRKDINNE